MASCGIDLILNAEVSGTTSTHVGSARILTGSNTYIGFRAMFGPTDSNTGSLEVKKFTGGASVNELNASGTDAGVGRGLQDISGSAITTDAFGANDWVDFYASGSAAATSVLIKGIKVTLE
tara:strand:+ start:133 stop:495 length:363 start_codon:yes stop_codon:yes gene_type:complete